jgi:putative nucleotidyltransferase with HDIG domain
LLVFFKEVDVDRAEILRRCKMPVMPRMAIRIMKLTSGPNAREELQHIISMDQTLTSQILAIANSSFYGLRRNIDTISEAIFVLGFNAVKAIALAISTKEIYGNHGILSQKLWEHAIGVSIIASKVADKLHIADFQPEEAVVGGLLHDVGKAVMLQGISESYQSLIKRVYSEHVSYIRLEKEVFGFDHQDVGALLIEQWSLPERLIKLVQYHHNCQSIDDEGVKTLCEIVRYADFICTRLGIGYKEPMPDLCDEEEERLADSFGFKLDDIEEIIGAFGERFISEKIAFVG